MAFRNNFPPVTIVMTTWLVTEQRVQVALDTLRSWMRNLCYDGELRLHVADDGSELSWEPDYWWVGDITFSRQERKGVGASLNAGFKQAFEVSPIVFYAVDDWRLDQPLDISPWVQLLVEREDVGIVRLGPPHPHLRGTIMPMTENWQGWGIILDRFGLCIGHRPELFHKRWTDYYGWHEENVSALECERLMSVRYVDMPDGPSIVYALPHSWMHIDQSVLPSTSHIDPRG